MTPDEIARDRAVIEAATEGPWHAVNMRSKESRHADPAADFCDHNGFWSFSNEAGALGWETDMGTPGYGITKDNAEFCAAARTRWPAALDEIERLRRALADDKLTLLAKAYAADWNAQRLEAENASLKAEMARMVLATECDGCRCKTEQSCPCCEGFTGQCPNKGRAP